MLSIFFGNFFGSFCPAFEQNFVNNSEDLTNIPPRKQSSEKLSKIFEDKCFDNKWSKALSALSPRVKAPNNENTIDKLKIFHPYEDPIMDQNFYGTYWENYPLMPSEEFSVIKKRPRGQSTGLSGITIDHVKAAIISSEDCLGLLTKFFNKTLNVQLKYQEELRSSRSVRKQKKILLPFQHGINTTDGVFYLLTATQSSTVFALNKEISTINAEKWGRCFPQSFNGNIPEKNVLNLKYTLRTLQKRLTGMYESDVYNNTCSSAVLNQDLHSLLLEKGVCESKSSDSSLLVTIVPRRFGLCATNEAFVTQMRLYLNIPVNQLLSKKNAQTARISCIKEPLLKETLSLNNFGSDDRGDVYCDWIDNSEAIVDFVSCNVANDTLVHRRKLNPVSALDFKAKEKHRKYDKDIEEANANRNTQLVAFPFSINGRLSDEAETFLNDFQKMVQEKRMKRFDIFYGVHGFNLPLLIDYLGF
ncbi:hypothetical protein P9112_006013 [Eukaryota sp. TZLM1-RC]